MEPFLHRVARAYIENDAEVLPHCCFVFPNKRSGTFFRSYLTSLSAGRVLVMPRITSIAELVADLSPLIEAPRIDQLMALYDEYCSLRGEPVDFDGFRFWGEMILNDFSDIDRYMVDAGALLVNLKRLREISANYFTPEQIEIIERYWGERPGLGNPEEFWRHIGNDEDAGRHEKFVKLWEELNPLYRRFTARLERAGMATGGRLSRDAAMMLRRGDTGSLDAERYVMVGHNVLSTSEIAIFERLHAMGRADFYWDCNSPAFALKGNRASRFVERNKAMFPSLHSLDEPPVEAFPEIKVIGVPSAAGQTRVAAAEIRRWIADKVIPDSSNAIGTALVLPDEQLLIPMIHAMPPEIGSLNVTMGYPMRHTSPATLMRLVAKMHEKARIVKGEAMYMRRDVMAVLTHPLIASTVTDAVLALSSRLGASRRVTVGADELLEAAPALEPVFATVGDANDPAGVTASVRRLVEWLTGLMAGADTDPVEMKFMEAYTDALNELDAACRRYRVTMREGTFYNMLDKSLAGATVSFTGEPLHGLQLMGVLETRALDFDNVVMLSMNERVFPRKQFARSFIPESLRAAYGMSTIDYQESIYAYYFYRLISRARHVTLLYDARNSAGRSNEMSRYIAQLLYLYPAASASHRTMLFDRYDAVRGKVTVKKTAEVMEKLRLYTVAESSRNLSASSINEFINCPLNFYLKYVEGFNPDNEIVDYMDASTYGTVLHEVVEHLYRAVTGEQTPVITNALIDRMKDEPLLLERLITESINLHFNNLPQGDRTPLRGEALMLGKVMQRFVVNMLEAERPFVPFQFLEAECRIARQVDIAPGLRVNIKQFIDRVDRVNIDRPDGGLLRVVDYKTGTDALSAPSVADMFNPAARNRAKAMMQLWFYCNAFAIDRGVENHPIQPIIYKFGDMARNGIKPVKVGREEVEDYREFNEEYLSEFRATVSRIFDPDEPFTQAVDPHSCKFCNFKAVCNRADAE